MNSKTMVEELVTWCLSGWKKPFYFSLFYRFNLSFANKQSCSLRSMESHVRTTIPLVPFNFLLTNELKFKLEVCMRHVQLNAICVWVWPKQNAIKSGSYHRFITFSSRVSIQSWAQKCYQFLEARVFHGLHHVMMNAGSCELWELRATSISQHSCSSWSFSISIACTLFGIISICFMFRVWRLWVERQQLFIGNNIHSI